MFARILEKLGIHKPSFTHEWVNKNEEEQTVDCNVFKDGKFSHTVRVRYFTREQIDRLRKLGKQDG